MSWAIEAIVAFNIAISFIFLIIEEPRNPSVVKGD